MNKVFPWNKIRINASDYIYLLLQDLSIKTELYKSTLMLVLYNLTTFWFPN